MRQWLRGGNLRLFVAELFKSYRIDEEWLDVVSVTAVDTDSRGHFAGVDHCGQISTLKKFDGARPFKLLGVLVVIDHPCDLVNVEGIELLQQSPRPNDCRHSVRTSGHPACLLDL